MMEGILIGLIIIVLFQFIVYRLPDDQRVPITIILALTVVVGLFCRWLLYG